MSTQPNAADRDAVAIGIDVGGTKIAAGTVDRTGAVTNAITRPTPLSGGRAALLDALAEVTGHLRARSRQDAIGVGVGTGGVVDHARGLILSATDLLPGWAGTPVGPWLAERCGLPVSVDNDGNTHALGELRFGAAHGYSDVLFAAVGTGVGGAVALGGALRRGAHDIAGELGHLPVAGAEGRRCSCGADGHLEAAAAGPAIARRHRELLGGDSPDLDLRAVAERARAGDAPATAAITEGATVLGRALAGLATAVDPQVVVLGGGVAEMGPVYWRPLRRAFEAEPYTRGCAIPILAARLGPVASVAGAAALAFDPRPAPRPEPRPEELS